MKVLLSNKFYYPRGGDCIYTLNLEQLLKDNGHEVAIFSMQHTENLPSQWEKYFPSEIQFSGGGLRSKLKAMFRPLHSREVSLKFRQLLRDFKPDVVHVNNIHSYLSPIIVEIAHQHSIPVAWTLHDYKLACSRYDCLRDKHICELCFTKKISVLKYRCMKNSLLASMLAYIEALIWNQKKIEKVTDCFICPSEFINGKMKQGGFIERKLVTVCNFIDKKKLIDVQLQKEEYVCYVGRLSHEKGIATLLEAASIAGIHLQIIGGGPMEKGLKSKYSSSLIEFKGYQNWESIKEIVSKAKFTVIPSEWYENNPLSVIESLCLGTPVLGANIGGIPELITSGVNGELFESGNVKELTEKLNLMMQNSISEFNYEQIAIDSQLRFSSEVYYDKLMDIYQSIRIDNQS